MLLVFLLIAVVGCCAAFTTLMFYRNAYNRLKDNVTEMEKILDHITSEHDKKIECLHSAYESSKNVLTKKYEDINKAYNNFKSHVHVIEVDAPIKRTPVYSAVKLSAFLKDYIKYDDKTNKCKLVVMDLNINE